MNSIAVRRSFNRAATSYNSEADLQRRVCTLLLGQLPTQKPATVIDAGSGTGHGLAQLRRLWPQASVNAVDFAPAMLRIAGGGICADIEALPFAAASFDLYWSNLTIQWCNTARTFAEAARVLKPGGQLAVSSLGPGTLIELRHAFAGIDAFHHVLDFLPIADLGAACLAAGLTDVSLSSRSLRTYHPTLRSSLLALKALGANQVGGRRRPGLLGRHAWQVIERRYEAHRIAAGLPSTYEVILCTAAKPTS